MASGDDGAGSGDNTLMDGRGRWHRLWRMASVGVREAIRGGGNGLKRQCKEKVMDRQRQTAGVVMA
jgi:hypothetical protein